MARYENDIWNILETCVWICNYDGNTKALCFNYKTGEIAYQKEQYGNNFIVIETQEQNYILFEAYVKLLQIPIEQAWAINYEKQLFTRYHSLMNSFFFEHKGEQIAKKLKASNPEYFKKD